MATAPNSFEIDPLPALCAALLEDLAEAHGRLHGEIANMGELTGQPDFDWSRFCVARWRISEASLARRKLAARIIDHLLPMVGKDEVAALKSLKASDQDMLRISAQHVGAWPPGAVQSDWSGYCRASQLVRSHMTASLTSEQRILVPILKAVQEGRSGHSGRPNVAADERVRLIR